MKQRVISAIVMVIICIPFLLLGGTYFRIGVGILSILAYKEIISLKGIKKYPKLTLVGGLISILLLVFSNTGDFYLAFGLNYKYLMAVFLIMFSPCVFFFSKNNYTCKDAFNLTSLIVFLGIIFNVISNIYIYDRAYFIMILLITILTDTFAYIIGMTLGKHRVYKISPKKSTEGFIGGALVGSIVTTIYYMRFIGAAKIYVAFPVILLMSIMCEIGDLFYSAIKRQEGIKDFSNLIPGHGGLLDRIDSLTFVTATYIILSSLI